MRNATLIALSILAFAAVSPAVAADAMMKDHMGSGSMMKMSAADTKKMDQCNAMSHDAMMKSASCKKMMKMHPDSMKSDGMMKHDSMMK
ncbi:MAG TPA: hypothetical protein VF503_15645 [Sphingobium sp.]|uniref:hypothetical protein n=1 Tax=Sphingobium sp. TaxID=1912891 RepID=UPI002ED52AE0